VILLGVVGLIPVLFIWTFIYRKLSRHSFDPIALFCYMFFLFYLFRDIVLSFGWDTIYPDGLFQPTQVGPALLKTSLILSLFLIMFIVGYLICRPLGGAVARGFPIAWKVPEVGKLRRLMIVLTIIATAVTAGLLARYGTFGGILRAGKVTKSLGGLYFLRVFPAIASVVSASLCLTLLQRRREGRPSNRPLVATSLFCALLNAAYVYLWGSRAVIAAVLFIFVAGQWQLGRGMVGSSSPKLERRSARTGQRRIRMLLTIGLLIGAVFGLRLIRDTALSGHVSKTIQGESEVRRFSVASNSTHFDATVLAIRDWPSTYGYRDGEDFITGLDGIVPRTVWAGKPTDIADGAWFRQVYQPAVKNGWPLSAVGDWYLNFGLLGVTAGGLISGLIFAGLMYIWRKVPRSPFMLAALICMVIFVVPTGFEALTPLYWFAWALPLILCGRYLDLRTHRVGYPDLAAGSSTLTFGG
jgi:hypothetical protein